MQSSKKSTPTIVGTIVIAAIVGVGGYNYATSSTSTETAVQGPTTSSSQTTKPTSGNGSTVETNSTNLSTQSSTVTYKDGAYTATAGYVVPHGGRNRVKATVTITNGKITNVVTSNNFSDQKSGYYIDSFDATIKSAMAGTSISNAYAGRVGGASLTSSAFNNALQTIETQAKV